MRKGLDVLLFFLTFVVACTGLKFRPDGSGPSTTERDPSLARPLSLLEFSDPQPGPSSSLVQRGVRQYSRILFDRIRLRRLRIFALYPFISFILRPIARMRQA